MKKKLIIFRFGMPFPVPKEMPIIEAIVGKDGLAMGCGTRFGVISIVETTMTPADVTKLFTQTAQETGDSLPVIVFEESPSVSFDFDPQLIEDFATCSQAFDDARASANCTLSLDELLDLVSKKGVEGLTEKELTRLKKLSK